MTPERPPKPHTIRPILSPVDQRLEEALARGDVAGARAALADGADPNVRVEGYRLKDEGGRTPCYESSLHYVLSDLDPDYPRTSTPVLPQVGARVPSMSKAEALGVRMELLTLLLAHGASHAQTDWQGYGLLDGALKTREPEVLALLLAQGVVESAALKHRSPLHGLAGRTAPLDQQERCYRFAALLMEAGCALEGEDLFQRTPLVVALLALQPGNIAALLRHGASVLPTSSGAWPIETLAQTRISVQRVPRMGEALSLLLPAMQAAWEHHPEHRTALVAAARAAHQTLEARTHGGDLDAQVHPSKSARTTAAALAQQWKEALAPLGDWVQAHTMAASLATELAAPGEGGRPRVRM